MKRDQEKAMFAKNLKKGFNVKTIDKEKYLMTGSASKTNLKLEHLGNVDDERAKGLRSFKESEGKRAWQKEIKSLKQPDNNWKKTALTKPYLGGDKDRDMEPLEVAWKSLPHTVRTEFWRTQGYEVDDSNNEDIRYWHEHKSFGRIPAIGKFIGNLSPKDLERGYLDDIEEGLQIHGHNAPFHDEGYLKNIPNQHRLFIDRIKNGVEMIRRIHILKRLLGFENRSHPRYWDERYSKVKFEDKDLDAFRDTKPSGDGYF